MKKEPMTVTAKKLRQWRDSNPIPRTGWELRRIFSQSEYLPIIAESAMLKDGGRESGCSWQEWWGSRLEQMDEQEAVNILFSAWGVDVRRHVLGIANQSAIQAINRISMGYSSAPPTENDGMPSI